MMMTLQQLSDIRQWLRLHGHRHPLELQAWDGVVMLWVMGWAALPALALLGLWQLLPLSLATWLLPALYARLRRRLHQAGRLRCDWLTAL